jgi:hypothetical protein
MKTAKPGQRAFDHVVIIMFENEYRNYVMENPYMRSLAEQGINMASYFGVMHPSNTNYVASIAGETCNITSDPVFATLEPAPPNPPPPPDPLPQRTVADRIREKKLQWRAYMETYNPVEYPPQLTEVMQPGTTTVDLVETAKRTILDYPPYMNMHNPFVLFQSICGHRRQWERIATLYDFFSDCLNDTLPEYSWITPGVWGDGHWVWGSFKDPAERAPALVNQLAKWLQTFFGVLNFPGPNSRIPPKTLVVVTFDESEYEQDYQAVNNLANDYDGPNQVYTVLLGDCIPPNQRVDNEGYNHYSLLKTIERNFGLESLGKNDTDANWLRFLWNEHFRWSPPEETPLDGAAFLAAAGLDKDLWVVSGDATGASARALSKEGWSAPSSVPVPGGTTAVAMASCDRQLVLICQTAAGLSMLTSAGDGSWSASQPIVASGAGSFSLTSFVDYGDQTEKLMLAYALNGTMQSQTYESGTWTGPVGIGQQTDGALVITALGTSLFLIYKVPGTNGMNAVSYNTAPFNVVTASNASKTTQYLWSPSAFPVAHFSYGPDRTGAGLPMPVPVTQAYEGLGPFAAATLDGVVHLVHAAASGSAAMTETFSISGIFTPQGVVDDIAGITASNGWGTLAEAGWSPQVPIEGVVAGGAMVMARFGSTIALLSQPSSGAGVKMSLGRYERS